MQENDNKQLKVLHIITTTNTGGAEMMLYKLLSRIDRKKFLCRVICLIPLGPVSAKIEALGVEVMSLDLKKGIPTPRALFRVIRFIKQWRPDIIQSWLYHADLLSLVAGKITGGAKIVWNIRCSNMDFNKYGRMTLLTVKLCAALSRFPDLVLTNSSNAIGWHRRMGYRPRRFEVQPNGFDMQKYQKDEDAGEKVRQELGVAADAFLIGFVARFDPQKDHDTFFKAASRLASVPLVYFVLCGDDISWNNEKLVHMIKKARVEHQVLLLGRREDLPSIYNAVDIVTLPSAYGEGFPNVVGEAMACSIPCLVSDVGDSAEIVKETGFTFKAGDHSALAVLWQKVKGFSAEERRSLGEDARLRILKKFELGKVVRQYEDRYLSLAST